MQPAGLIGPFYESYSWRGGSGPMLCFRGTKCFGQIVLAGVRRAYGADPRREMDGIARGRCACTVDSLSLLGPCGFVVQLANHYVFCGLFAFSILRPRHLFSLYWHCQGLKILHLIGYTSDTSPALRGRMSACEASSSWLERMSGIGP